LKLYDFLRLSDEEQYNTTWEIGKLVDQYINDNIAINLYAINEFFIEVYFDRATDNILYKKTFKRGELLDKYLDRIKL